MKSLIGVGNKTALINYSRAKPRENEKLRRMSLRSSFLYKKVIGLMKKLQNISNAKKK